MAEELQIDKKFSLVSRRSWFRSVASKSLIFLQGIEEFFRYYLKFELVATPEICEILGNAGGAFREFDVEGAPSLLSE